MLNLWFFLKLWEWSDVKNKCCECIMILKIMWNSMLIIKKEIISLFILGKWIVELVLKMYFFWELNYE